MSMNTFDITTFRELKTYIACDLFRYMTSTSFRAFLRGWYIAGFRYTFFMRTTKYLACKGGVIKLLWLISRIALRHYSVKYGFQIPYQAAVGPGLAIGHYGTIIVNPNSTIGANCNLSVDVLMGLDFDKSTDRFVYPSIGDRVSLGNGVKVIGDVFVGNDSIVGVSSVVTKSLPPKSVAIGTPARVISSEGSAQFVGSFHPESLKYHI